MKLRHILTIGLLFAAEAVCFPQSAQVRTRVATYLAGFGTSFAGRSEACKLENMTIDDKGRTVDIYASEVLGTQPMNPERVAQIYAELRALLPTSAAAYRLRLYTKGVLIDDLVPGGAEGDASRRWADRSHRAAPWVTPLDRPYPVSRGLEGRHLSVCASHGRFYSLSEATWRWQRPRLFCTTEDLFSQTFVVPFLIPMLENAGAVVYSPRERDWQKHEVIVDNDTPDQGGTYAEKNGAYSWEDAGTGFAHLRSVYLDGENPFTEGTARSVPTQSRRSQTSTITWTPAIPADGRYAVYVSYPTLPTSVQDAHYTVRHRGIATSFRVNQQMGGGTWVYLGTFDFAAGSSADNCVVLSNQSGYRGHVSADAVRFGGGMGNIARGDSLTAAVSGLPRFLEGARYAAQWAGLPYAVYGNKNSTNDYAEDINVRSRATNYLARRSAYLPTDSIGLGVPIEMSIALHTDAGFTRDLSHIGSLSIYTTNYTEGRYPSGLSRLTSRDLCDLVLTQVDNDLRATYGRWTRRQMYDRNYSESREPEVPAIILEMLSHQNFADLWLGHDPSFKFTLARAAYKGILRFVHAMHGSAADAVVQPLPVTGLGAYVTPATTQIRVSWLAVEDPLEPTAMPTAFVVYHAVGDGDFDNGTLVSEAHYELDGAAPDVLHRFRVTAVNDGGQSMTSEEVCAFISMMGDKQVMVIDAFDRLAGPQPLDNDSLQGFDLATDPGVPMGVMPGYCGQQICFGKEGMGREGFGGLGHSTAELEGMLLAGNTRDWTTVHARDIIEASGRRMTLSSCTVSAVGRADFDSRSSAVMDIVFGAEKADGYSLRPAQVFPPTLVQAVAEFVRSGGSVLVSGAYVGSDMVSEADRLLTRSLLKYEYAGALNADSIQGITSNDGTFDIYRQLNEQRYAVPAVDCLAPTADAFCPMVYSPGGQSAAVAYDGRDYRAITLGFPLEGITDPDMRRRILSNILIFLTR